MTVPTEEQVERYLERHPDATPAELAGALTLPPEKARGYVDEHNVAPDDGTDDADPPTPAEHYSRVGDVYAELGRMDSAQCIGNHDFVGWYNERGDRGRPYALSKEWPAMEQEIERVVYSTLNYVPDSWYLNAWTGYEYTDSGREWHGEKPMPGYGDLQAFIPFADIDLTDEVKYRRPDGDIPQEAVERALSLYLEAFAELAGGMEHVYALDSVGGAYALISPTATAPIADEFDKSDREVIFKDMTDRLNEWLDSVKDDVHDAVPDVEGVFEPDLLNNKNRPYKAPMSIHSSLDGVVTPIDPENVSFDYTPLEAVSDDDIAAAEAWADEFTSGHSDAVGAIVANLWPDYAGDADGWQNAVSARIDDLNEKQEANRERNEMSLSEGDLPDDIEETDDIEVVNAKIEAIDVRDVARDVADEWDTDPGRDPPRFDPPWRNSDSGTSCYADREKYVDLKEGKNGGGALTLAARAAGILTSSSRQLRGDDYWKGVNELRRLGYDIPYFTGSSGTHPDAMQLLEEPEDTDDARRQALRAMRASKR